MTVIADTSFVVSTFFSNDNRHKDCLKVYQQQSTIYLPQSTLAEVMYLLGRGGGNLAVANFLDGILAGKYKYEIIPLELIDLQRTTALLKQYTSARVDFVDLTVIAVAERLNITIILILDVCDFSIVRPQHCSFFTLLPST